MKTFNYKREWILWLILLAPVAYLIGAWSALPNQVPIHFSATGEPNDWAGKASEFILIGVNIVVYILTPMLNKIDPKQLDEGFFTSNFFKMRLWLTAFLSLLSIVMIYVALPGHEQYSTHLIPTCVFLMIAAMGNFMVNLKPNWFWGIRTPWTLSSDTVWRKTHQIGGRIWFYGGLICVAANFLLPGAWATTVIIGFLAVTLFFSFGYSFWLFKQEQANGEGRG